MNAQALFHLAFPVNDLEEARRFYGGLLGCPEDRSSPNWIDFDFYGHQIVAHLSPDEWPPRYQRGQRLHRSEQRFPRSGGTGDS
jgi:extradiol dioxygenase family protein